MVNQWYFIPYTLYGGALNMAVDALLWEDYRRWLDRPLLRFYGWAPPAISIGHSQKLSDIDMEKAKKDRVEVVRRPTGGRAIFHHEELTYAVIAPVEHFPKEELYAAANRWFYNVLRKLGLSVVLESEQPDFRKEYRKPESAPCFSSVARYEIKADGRKIVGSAQRIGQQAILQHGSFMLGRSHLRLLDYLGLGAEAAERAREALEKSATELNSLVENPLDAEDFAGMVKEEVKAGGIELAPYPRLEELLNTAGDFADRFDLNAVEKY